jgi:hypothetical protein
LFLNPLTLITVDGCGGVTRKGHTGTATRGPGFNTGGNAWASPRHRRAGSGAIAVGYRRALLLFVTMQLLIYYFISTLIPAFLSLGKRILIITTVISGWMEYILNKWNDYETTENTIYYKVYC